MNVNLYGCRGKWVMVDLGLTFADPDYPGIELILPDLEFIEEQQDGSPASSSPTAMRTISARCPISPTISGAALCDAVHRRPDRRQARGGGADRAGEAQHRRARRRASSSARSASASSRSPTRSPRATALLIETPFGRIFHTGDWKIDETPVLGEAPSTEVLTRDRRRGRARAGLRFDQRVPGQAVGLGRRASTRACWRRSPRPRAACWSRPSRRTPRGCRRSAGSPTDTGRQVCVAGRSLDRILRVAQATGYLQDFPPPIDFDEAMRLPRSEVLIIATGGQGEPRAALGRIAVGHARAQARRGRHGHLLVADHPRQRDRDRPDHEPAVRPRRADRHREAGARPCLRPPRPARADRDVRLGPAARSSSRSTARRGTWPSMPGSRWRTACRRRSSRRTAT